MALKKSKSRRKSSKINRIIKKKVKAANKRMKKQGRKKPLKKDPGIPNLYPFKKQLLEKILKNKQQHEQEKLLKRKAKKENKEMEDEQPANDNVPQPKPAEEKETIPPQNKNYTKMLNQAIEKSDILLFVLDARDPEGTRDKKLEAVIQSKPSASLGSNKKLLLVLNKIDLVPSDVVESWLRHLKNELPAIAFKACTQNQKRNLGISKMSEKKVTESELSHTKLCVGAETLISLIKNYSRVGDKGMASVTVGVIGYPNVGKSSIINSLKRKKIASTSPVPGHTKEVQQVYLDKKIKLLDSPGVVFSNATNYSTLVLNNSVRVEKLKSPEDFVSQILKKCPVANLCEIYQIPAYDSLEKFLFLVGSKKGIFGKGGKVNTDATARSVIRDWNSGKISYYSNPPQNPIKDTSMVDEETLMFDLKCEETKKDPESNVWGDLQPILDQSAHDIRVCEMRSGEDIAEETKNFVAIEEK